MARKLETRINAQGGAYNVLIAPTGESFRTVDWFGPHIWELSSHDILRTKDL